MSVTIDRRQEEKLLAAFKEQPVSRIMGIAAEKGAKAAAKLVRSAAPIGKAERLGQYYRRQGLPHGTLRKSVRAAPIRSRGTGIVGYVVAPMGRNAFTRHWIELGTRRTPGKHWLASVATSAFSVAQRASESVLELYARRAG